MSDSVRSSTPEGSFNLLQESLEVRTSYLSPNRAALTPEFKIRPSIISPSPFRMPSSTTSATASINAQGIAIEDSSLNNETSPESLTPESRSISSSVAAYDREAFDTELIDPAMVDRFGFLIKDLEQLDLDLSTATSTSSSNKQSKEKKEKYQTFKENARSMKWVRMLKRLEKYPITAWAKKSDKFVHRLYKGIPNSLRTYVWDKMLSDMWARQVPPLGRRNIDFPFEELYSRASSHERQIDLDIERTLRNHVLFKLRFGTGQSSLFKVLVALANQNPEVGYCQGMSTVAAFFLLYFDEERAFRHLRTLFRSQELDRLYAHHFPKLFETFYIHEQLLARYYPKISDHFLEHQITTPIYATRWYLTLFLGLPYLVAARVWDLFLFYGYDILLHAGITLLGYFSEKLLNGTNDFERTMELLSKSENEIIHPDKFIKMLKATWTESYKSESYSVPYLRSIFFIENNQCSPIVDS